MKKIKSYIRISTYLIGRLGEGGYIQIVFFFLGAIFHGLNYSIYFGSLRHESLEKDIYGLILNKINCKLYIWTNIEQNFPLNY